MPITIEQGRELVSEFCRIYPAAYQLKYKVRATQEEIFGKGATIEKKGVLFGAYFPAERMVALVASNAPDIQHFTETIRHEVLGHFGLNTLRASEKKAIVDVISKTRGQPSLSKVWSNIDVHYPKHLELFKAEEIFCIACESIKPNQTISSLRARHVFHQVVLARSRSMDRHDLSAIAIMVADGLKNRTRFQQTFPATDNDQWSREGN